MLKIMLVEDDHYLLEELIATLRKANYEAVGVSNFEAFERILPNYQPDLIILDVTLPTKSGYEICQWIKDRYTLPILILTARDTVEDEVSAFEIGADDFLSKPCHPSRLLARVERLLKTYGKLTHTLTIDQIAYDFDHYTIRYQGKMLILAETEGKILKLLMKSYPNTVTYQELFSEIWGTKEFVDENILRVNIARLRKSLDSIGLGRYILTIRGVGYGFGEKL